MIQPVYPSQWIKEVATSYACLTLECQSYTFLYDLNSGKISLHVPNVIRPKWFRGVTQPIRIGMQEKSLVFIYQGRKLGGRKKHLLPAQQIPRARNTEYDVAYASRCYACLSKRKTRRSNTRTPPLFFGLCMSKWFDTPFTYPDTCLFLTKYTLITKLRIHRTVGILFHRIILMAKFL